MHLIFTLVSIILFFEFIKCRIPFSECGNTVNCYTIPSSCNSYDSCNGVAMWRADPPSNTIQIEISTKHNYVAFGQNTKSRSNKMDQLEGAYCVKNGGTALLGFFTSRGYSPTFRAAQSGSTNDVSTFETESNSNIITCRYKMEGNRATNLLAANDMIPVIAYGDNTSGGKPRYHSGRTYSNTPVQWSENPTPITTTTTTTTKKTTTTTLKPSTKDTTTTILNPSTKDTTTTTLKPTTKETIATTQSKTIKSSTITQQPNNGATKPTTTTRGGSTVLTGGIAVVLMAIVTLFWI